MTKFKDVKDMLDAQIALWRTANGRDPNLIGKHGSTTFKWNSLDELKAATVVKAGKTYPVIDTSKIGKPGEGVKMNLIVALSNPSGVNNFGQMPDGGPDLPCFFGPRLI